MPNDVQYWMRIVLIGIVSAIAIFDLLLLARHGADATISVALRNLSYEFPILPYLIAFGMGAFLYHILNR